LARHQNDSRGAVARLQSAQCPLSFAANLHGLIVDDPPPPFSECADYLQEMASGLPPIHRFIPQRMTRVTQHEGGSQGEIRLPPDCHYRSAPALKPAPPLRDL
jgi:hypothetical protein